MVKEQALIQNLNIEIKYNFSYKYCKFTSKFAQRSHSLEKKPEL